MEYYAAEYFAAKKIDIDLEILKIKLCENPHHRNFTHYIKPV